MIIAGIDYSKNSPGIVSLFLHDYTLDVVNIDYIGFTTVKKNEKLAKLVHYKKDTWSDDIAKAQGMADCIAGYLADNTFNNCWPQYVAFEGYAYAAKGKVFDIAEATMVTKLRMYDNGCKIRIYDPNTIKKFASGHGNADKVRMGESFNKFDGMKPEIDLLADAKSPKEDIVDAFFAAKLLQLELKLRKGLIAVKDLPMKQIEVFNRVTKAYPENILVRPFIHKGGNDE